MQLNTNARTGDFSIPISGLTPETQYYFCAFARNSDGAIVYGNVISVITKSIPPSLTTSIGNYGSTNATIVGNITSAGSGTITQSGICFNTAKSPTISNNKILSSATLGSYSSIVNNLIPFTLYYARAYAITAKDTAYGNEITFTTQHGWYELGLTDIFGFNSISFLATDYQNNLYVGGFTNVVYFVAKWDGIKWVKLLPGFNSPILSIATDNSTVYAGGSFKNSSGNYYIAKWENNSWKEVGGENSLAAISYIDDIAISANSDIYAITSFSVNNNTYVPGLAKFNGNTWQQIAGVQTSLSEGTFFSKDNKGNIYCRAHNNNFYNIYKWTGSMWQQLGNNKDFYISSNLISDIIGNTYVGLQTANSNGYYYVSKWNGISWEELGGLNSLNANGMIYRICTDNNGNIFATGNFKNAYGKYYVAKWNGTSWQDLSGLYFSDRIWGLTADNNGNLYAIGDYKNIDGKTYVAAYR